MATSAAALGQFCQLKASIQEMDSRRKEAVAAHDTTRCKLRDGLIAWMQETNLNVVQLPETVDADGRVQYRTIRLRQCTSQRAITTQAVERSFANLLFSGSLDKAPVDLTQATDVVKDSLYQAVRASCTTVTPGITVTSAAKKPARIPQEQLRKQQQLSAADLARLEQIANAYVASAASMKERRTHYNKAKTILESNLSKCEPVVQQQLQQQRVEHGKASRTIELRTDSPGNPAPEEYVVCLHTSRAGPLDCKLKRLNYATLKSIINEAAERRIRKLQARGVRMIPQHDLAKMLAADVVAAVQRYNDSVASERKSLLQQRKRDPSSATTKVVLRKKKTPPHWRVKGSRGSPR